ncbi:hypothetical protein V491_00908 [Pseudogymnoascus sp. VKM F-3775]|nr:hypothetical protein V491_00908 [Pseudogymnoascus sp. VKM F-3775]
MDTQITKLDSSASASRIEADEANTSKGVNVDWAQLLGWDPRWDYSLSEVAIMTTQNEIRTRPQSSTRTIFTGQDVNGPILIQDPPYDGRGVIDLTCELNSNFAMLQTNMKLLQSRVAIPHEADTDTICEEQWIKTEKATEEKERENQWLRAENSRLGRELQNAKYANNGSTEGLDDEDFMGACNSSAVTNASGSANSTIGIQKWRGKGCTGHMVENKNLTSLLGNTNIYTSREPFLSFKISRPLRGREQLDFSREKFTFGNYNTSMFGIGTDWCGNFLQSYWPWTSPDGCVDLGTFRCVRIWLN